MKLFGEVRSLKIVGYKDYWDLPNLFCFFDEDPISVKVYIDDVCQPLTNYLTNRSTCTNEPFSEDHQEKARMISVSELRYKHCLEMKDLIERRKANSAGMIHYKHCDQLSSILKRINMIAELGDVKGDELFLRFCLI